MFYSVTLCYSGTNTQIYIPFLVCFNNLSRAYHIPSSTGYLYHSSLFSGDVFRSEWWWNPILHNRTRYTYSTSISYYTGLMKTALNREYNKACTIARRLIMERDTNKAWHTNGYSNYNMVNSCRRQSWPSCSLFVPFIPVIGSSSWRRCSYLFLC